MKSCLSIVWLSASVFQVSLLQVVLPRFLPAYPVRLQAAFPGAAVHEHHPPTQAVSLQRVTRAEMEAQYVRVWFRVNESM